MPGYSTALDAPLRERALDLGVAGDVRFTGWLPRADVCGLLGMAALLVHPSFAEGFGLPVLEAMGSGLPVACSDSPVLRELAGDCALFFDPGDAGSIERAITVLLTDRTRAAGLAVAGRRRAHGYSWDATARATLESYERAVAAERSAPR
jgi:glycosyltransferase involved in cell wall biosynthesis